MQLGASYEKPADIMSDERTPLIQRVEVRPHRDHYPHHRLRFICTSILSTVTLAGGIAAIILLGPSGAYHTNPKPVADPITSPLSTSQVPDGWFGKTALEFEELQSLLLNTPDAEQARRWSEYYTSGPHLAGKNLSQALWTKERWQEFGIESTIVDYDVYINYPKSHRLALLEKTKADSISPAATEAEWKVTYEASLEEDVLDEDKTSQLADRIPTFHGYSASGNVTAPYVFVNYGTYKDFEDLEAANVTLEGKIALAKYGHVFRGLKVKRAQELGMVGVVMYSDPGDDGEVTEKNGMEAYPNGPARQPSSVQRGSVQFLSTHHSSSVRDWANTTRLRTRRPYHARLPLEARCPPSTRRPRDAAHPFAPHILPRRAASTQSAQRPRPQSIVLRPGLADGRAGLQGRQVQHRPVAGRRGAEPRQRAGVRHHAAL
jgi:N-acetylated-alpha-linked acidic dipeptidase